ncbi:MAG: hypothetical protein AABX03_00720 [Nanoarchaeota archaeon]
MKRKINTNPYDFGPSYLREAQILYSDSLNDVKITLEMQRDYLEARDMADSYGEDVSTLPKRLGETEKVSGLLAVAYPVTTYFESLIRPEDLVSDHYEEMRDRIAS